MLTKQAPVADPGVGARLLKVHCHESTLSMLITMAMSMNTMSMVNSLLSLFLMIFVKLLVLGDSLVVEGVNERTALL